MDREDQSKELPVVLVVDDDPLTIKIIHTLLTDMATVITGANTNDALRLMREHHPKLVLLDDIMPGGVSGLQFLEQIKDDEELSKIPVVMVTASGKPEEVLRGLNAGAVDYVTKPFKHDLLQDIVRKRLSMQPVRVYVALGDKALEQELVDQLQRLQCVVEGEGEGNFSLSSPLESPPDLLILGDRDAFFYARKIHALKKEGSLRSLGVIALIVEDVADIEAEDIFFLPLEAPLPIILQTAGRLLKRKKL